MKNNKENTSDQAAGSSGISPLSWVLIAGLAVGAFALGAIWSRRESTLPLVDSPTQEEQPRLPANVLKLTPAQERSAQISTKPSELMPVARSLRLTGKVSLNEDRIAHIYPMVEGSVDRVDVALGQVVKQDDLLVVIHSREIGTAKLELYQARLNLELATMKNEMQVEITKNAQELLVSLRNQQPIQEIENQFRNRGMGDYRERLLQAYANYLKSRSDLERLSSLTDSGAISAKQFVVAQTNRDADQAAFQARIEQIDYELQTSLLSASQAVREASTRVSVAETNLRILGCSESDIQEIDPDRQKESISDYSIRAPFDGTVVSKDAALREQVSPSKQVLSVADLSQVWINVDVYEKDLPALSGADNKALQVTNEAWPDRTFEAKVFYGGEIMDDRTRTVSMRAVAENPDQILKPGMFVTVNVPTDGTDSVLVIPKSALFEHQGEQFVFVKLEPEIYMKRTVKTIVGDKEHLVVLSGVSEGESVVESGGFILKSVLLADLMGEE